MGCASCNSVKPSKGGCKNSDTCTRCNKFSVFDWLGNVTTSSTTKRCSIIELSFKNGRKEYYDNPNNLNFKIGDPIVVQCTIGHDIGLVSLKGELIHLQLKRKQIKKDDIQPVLRIPSQIDLDKWHQAISLEKSTMLYTRKIVKDLKLKMKITDVEFQADGKRAIFYYLADSRIDFRELVKLLASNLNIKILMKQVGARQEAGIVGGIGACGRELCCGSWLHDMRSVNISAARYQKLSLNPQKITGQCGKLKCCLNYELDNYMEALKDFPKNNTPIETKKGVAIVQKIDIFKKVIWYSYVKGGGDWIQVDLDVVNKMILLNKSGKSNFLIEDFYRQNN
ncbi:MAG: hypothetical protein CMD23_00575 [Flavobacteriales bacterium]|nr:hypothetical protein [Flavobacteriales bacterium]